MNSVQISALLLFVCAVVPSIADDGRLIWVSSTDQGQLVQSSAKDGVETLLHLKALHGGNWALSPDARRLTFIATKGFAEPGDIHDVALDGLHEARNLTHHPADESTPRWSPDGTAIAFISDHGPATTDPALFANHRLWVMAPDGSQRKKLTSISSPPFSVTWSPDGSRIAFQSEHGGNTDIYVVRADGSGLKNLTNHAAEDGWCAWSPDGSKLIFQSNRDGNSDIFVMNADGSRVRNLTNNPHDDIWCVWAPNGRTVAFQSNRDGNWEIYIVDIDDLRTTRVTHDPGDDREPVWAPDGRRIAFLSDRDGLIGVFVADANGANVKRVSERETTSVDTIVAWQPSHHTKARRAGPPASIAELVRSGDEAKGSGDHETANAFYAKAIIRAPSYAGDYVTDINLVLPITPLFDEAMRACIKAIKTNPHDAAAYANLGFLCRIAPSRAETSLKELGIWDSALDQANQPAWFRVVRPAEIPLLIATELDPASKSAYHNLGRTYRDLREERAERAYRRALELDPDDMEVLASLAFVLSLSPASRSRAVPLYESILANTKCGSDAHLYAMSYLGSAYADLGERQKALDALSRIPRCLPGEPGPSSGLHLVVAEQALDRVGADSLAAKEYERAITAFQTVRALPIKKNNYSRLVEIGKAYEALERFADAENSYTNAIRESTRSGGERQGEAVFRLAFLHFDRGDFDAAASVWAQFIDMVNGSGEATDSEKALLHRFAGQIHLKGSRYDAAVRATSISVGLNDGDAVAHNQLGVAYYFVGEYGRSAAALQRAVAINPHNARYYKSLGDVYYEMQYLEQALATHQRAKDVEPSNPLHWADSALCLIELARYDETIKMLSDGTRRFPDDATLAFWLGEAYSRQGRDAEARTWFGKSNRLSPAVDGDTERLIAELERKGRSAEEQQNLYRALRHYAEACRYWAGRSTRDRQRQNVFRIYNRLPAKPVLPAGAIDHARRGEEAFRARNLRGAADAYEEALDLAPWWAEGYFNLALVRAAIKEWQEAITNLENFLALMSDAGERERAVKLISQWQVGQWSEKGGRN